MNSRLRSRKVLLSSVVAAILIATGVALRWQGWRVRPFPQSVNLEQRDDWQPFGGAWQFADGTMLNNSDERGAKLMNGDTHLTDYMIEADVQLLARAG